MGQKDFEDKKRYVLYSINSQLQQRALKEAGFLMKNISEGIQNDTAAVNSIK